MERAAELAKDSCSGGRHLSLCFLQLTEMTGHTNSLVK